MTACASAVRSLRLVWECLLSERDGESGLLFLAVRISSRSSVQLLLLLQLAALHVDKYNIAIDPILMFT